MESIVKMAVYGGQVHRSNAVSDLFVQVITTGLVKSMISHVSVDITYGILLSCRCKPALYRPAIFTFKIGLCSVYNDRKIGNIGVFKSIMTRESRTAKMTSGIIVIDDIIIVASPSQKFAIEIDFFGTW